MGAERPKIVVVGCGGIGGVLAARLAAAGADVSAITHNPDVAKSIAARGLVAVWDGEFHNHAVPAWATLETRQDSGESSLFDLVLLATPPDAAVAAVHAIEPALTVEAPIVVLQNGLLEERLSRTFDAERVIGGVVAFGASMEDPGKVQQTSNGGITLGRLVHQDEDPVLEWVESLLSVAIPIKRSRNLRGSRWSKLAINCTISACGAITGETLGSMLRARFVRRLALETMTEVVQVALAEGVQLEKVSGTLDLEWLAMDADERLRGGSPSLMAKHGVLLAVGAKYRRLRSSLRRAIERGRTPSVVDLNGEIVERGKRHNIPTPINEALMDAVFSVARGERKANMQTLETVYEDTRKVLRNLRLVA